MKPPLLIEPCSCLHRFPTKPSFSCFDPNVVTDMYSTQWDTLPFTLHLLGIPVDRIGSCVIDYLSRSDIYPFLRPDAAYASII